jgi:hypothetical protein
MEFGADRFLPIFAWFLPGPVNPTGRAGTVETIRPGYSVKSSKMIHGSGEFVRKRRGKDAV